MTTEKQDHPQAVTVAVIIPAHNAAEFISAQLEAVLPQTRGIFAEVIVVDDASTDDSVAIALGRMSGYDNARIVQSPTNIGPAAARNLGAKHTSAELLVFCDADDVVSPNWLGMMMRDSALADILGGWLNVDVLNAPARRTWRTAYTRGRLPVAEGHLPYAQSASLAVWANTYRVIGGFDSRFKRGCEDVDFSWRAQRLGFTLAPSTSEVYYRHRSTAQDLYRQFYEYGRYLPLLRQSHGLPSNTRVELLRRGVWLLSRLPYLASARRRGVLVRNYARWLGEIVGRVECARQGGTQTSIRKEHDGAI